MSKVRRLGFAVLLASFISSLAASLSSLLTLLGFLMPGGAAL